MCVCVPLHSRVRELFSVNNQVCVVGGFESEAPVTDHTAVSALFVHLHDVFQVITAFGERHLSNREDGIPWNSARQTGYGSKYSKH